jgi:hypothetical protein
MKSHIAEARGRNEGIQHLDENATVKHT